jgi:hypothetical protein
MIKKNYDTKVLKAVMAGAVAFTPIIAIGVDVDKVSAASGIQEVDTLISKLNAAYDLLNPVQKGQLQSAYGKINRQLAGAAWETNLDSILDAKIVGGQKIAAKKVVGELVKLLATSSTGYNMEQAFSTFNGEISDQDIKAAFGSDITKVQFVSFLVYVESNIFSQLSSTNETSTYFDVFEDVLYGSLGNTSHRQVALAISETVDAKKVKPVLQSIVAGATITQAEKDAFKALVGKYNPPASGGGVVTPPTADKEVVTDSNAIENNPQSVIDSINKAPKLEELVINTPANATEISIPVTVLNAVETKNSQAVIHVNFGAVSYELPVTAIDTSAIAKQLGVAASDLKLVVTAKKVDVPSKVDSTFNVLSDSVDFEVSLVAPDGKFVAINVFPKPVKRTLPGTNSLNIRTTVGVTVDANGKVTAVPTYVGDDKKSADLYRSGNSVYTLIENSKTFIDVDKGASWAEEYVEKLASRMVVNGKTETKFQPTATITRGEFAAILARGLGIVPADKNAKKFKDVSSSQAFNQNSEITAVVEAGIVAGYGDGTFRPYEEITRDQAAIMISRAIDYVGKEKVTFDSKKKASSFKDYSKIGAASRSHVERVYQAGFLDGYTDDTFRPAADADRGQTAKILYNFLASVKYIN